MIVIIVTSKLANQISSHIRLFFVLSLKLQDSLSPSLFFVEIHKFVADFMQLIYDENFYEKLIYAWYSAQKCRSDATKYYDMVQCLNDHIVASSFFDDWTAFSKYHIEVVF